MLKKLLIRNFKSFIDVEIDLSQTVVFIGPNNSGKTTALQALALWDAGCRHWLSKRDSDKKKDAAKAVTIGRKDLVYLQLPSSNAMWRDLRVREGYKEDDKPKTKNILIEIIVEGEDEQGQWQCGLEFEYVNEEYFYCRPLRTNDSDKPNRMVVPVDRVRNIKLAFLPPMSGLLLEEPLLQPGRVEVMLGSGRSGEILRNLCYALWERKDGGWQSVVKAMKSLFGATLRDPEFVAQLGTLEISYQQQNGTDLPLNSAGLGQQQTLLLLAYMHLNPGAVILLDEPDAHLEILRQRQTYHLITEIARHTNAQVICASHSEVVLNEAIERDTVVAFVGKPHLISDERGSQVLKALRDYGFENYIQAEQTGWVLYLEGSTDLALLQAWARRLNHPATNALEKPFVHYLNTNVPSVACSHFAAVKEANPKLLGVALFDRLEKNIQGEMIGLAQVEWSRREIENYICTESVLIRYAKGDDLPEDLISGVEKESRLVAMRETIEEMEQAAKVFGTSLWSGDAKASEEVLPRIFALYRTKINDIRIPSKKDYFTLVDYQLPDEVDPEVIEKLDLIAKQAALATPHEVAEATPKKVVK
jgi:predicted ATPase